MRKPHLIALIALALAGVFVAAGCGSDSKSVGANDVAVVGDIDAETHAAVADAEAIARAAPRAVPGHPRDPGLDRRRLVVAELTYRAAFAAAIAQEMDRDPSVVLIGEDIGAAGGVFKPTEGLLAGSGRSASATRRSASRRSSARRWARR